MKISRIYYDYKQKYINIFIYKQTFLENEVETRQNFVFKGSEFMQEIKIP